MSTRYLATLASAVSLGLAVVARSQPTTAPAIEIEAVLVELAPSQLEAVRSFQSQVVGRGPGGAKTEVAQSTLLTRNAWETLRQGVESGRIPGRIICSPTVTTASGKMATAEVGGVSHYLEKTEEGLYRLTPFKTGLSFTVTPRIVEGGVDMALEISHVQLQGRTVYPEAPDLAIGPPITSCNSVSTRVILSHDEVVAVLGGVTGQTKPTTFCLVGWVAGR